MTKLLIHIGTHKTGTTTIQHALRNISAVAGAQEGWQYLETPRAAAKLMYSRAYDERIVGEFKKDLAKKTARSGKPSRIIMSFEGLSGQPGDGYMNSGAAATMLRDITKDFDVKIIVYLRRQDDMVESMYTQKIHEGSSFKFEEFLSRLKPGTSYDYSRILQDWACSFGKDNLVVRSYHAASRRGLLKDFAEIIGSAELSRSKPARQNPSFSHDAIEIARGANAVLDKPSRKQLRRILHKTMAKQAAESHSLFSSGDRKAFLDLYRDTNRDVADYYFAGEALENVFPEPAASASEIENGTRKNCMPHDEVVPLVIELLKQNNPGTRLVEGAKNALSGYPELRRILLGVVRRG